MTKSVKKEDRKGLLALLLLGLGGVVALAMGKKPTGYGASVSLQIVDAATGELVPHHSPLDLDEGGSYTLQLSVTNNSTRLEVLVGATLTMDVIAEVGDPLAGTYIAFVADHFSYAFGPGESRGWSYPFIVPDGTAGRTGGAQGTVLNPTGGTVASTPILPLTIIAAAIIYAAGVTIEIP